MGLFSFRSPLGAVFTLLAGVAAVAVACFLILATAAARKTTRARQGWERSLGSYDEILQRYPSTEANASALELERLSARLGVNTATRTYADRAQPTDESAAEHRRVKIELSGYLTRHVEQPNDLPDQFPPEPSPQSSSTESLPDTRRFSAACAPARANSARQTKRE